jgi:hypothetical protein
MRIAPSAKNGILIVEVAREGCTIRGLPILDAAVEASPLCSFRPILITSRTVYELSVPVRRMRPAVCRLSGGQSQGIGGQACTARRWIEAHST